MSEENEVANEQRENVEPKIVESGEKNPKKILKKRPPMDEQKEAEIIPDSRWKLKIEAVGGRSHVQFESFTLNGINCPRIKSIYNEDGDYQLDIKQKRLDQASPSSLSDLNGRKGWWFVLRSNRSKKYDELPFHFEDLNEREDEVLGIPSQGQLTLSLSFEENLVAQLGPSHYKKTPLGNGIKGHKKNIRLEKNLEEKPSNVGEKRKRSSSSTPSDEVTGLVRLLNQEEEHGKWLPVVSVRMFVPWELLPSQFTSEERTVQLSTENQNRIVPRHICFNRHNEILPQSPGKKKKKPMEPLPVEQIFEFDKRKPAAFRLSLNRIGDEKVSMDYTGYTIKELKDHLAELNLPVSGTKVQLLERFKSAYSGSKIEEMDAGTITLSPKNEVKVASLRQTLKDLGMPTVGTKEQLIKRLEEYRNSSSSQQPANNTIAHFSNPITA
eukprot:TRINITY_DN2348_c0_g1_i1.p1 TRINITY_DN2348_c0_g1~~TRINITY_DN2348_c0_g1_i1.p1  ORF type:complete len:439 (-),score=184.35 TRINITY_DN2348_c0_g1_i1:106-1422(-)